jgi:hypothetical protein
LHEFRAISTKVGVSEFKTLISFTQFENALKHIAYGSFTHSLGMNDKLKMLFLHIKNPIKLQYRLSLLVDEASPTKDLSHSEENSIIKRRIQSQPGNRTGRTNRRTESQLSTEESGLILDVNINAALEALKSPRGERWSSSSPGKETLMTKTKPPTTEKKSFASKNTRDKVIKSIRAASQFKREERKMETSPSPRFNKMISEEEKPTAKKNSFKIDGLSNKILNEKVELTEFIETERMVKNDVLNVKVALVDEGDKTFTGQVSPRYERPRTQTIPARLTFPSPNLRAISPVTKEIGQIQAAFEHFKQRHQKLSESNSHNTSNTSKPKMTLLREHREFIIRKQRSSFSSQFVIGMIFRSWKDFTNRKKGRRE